MIDALITRLKAQAPSLGNRVEGAAGLSALMAAKAYPQTVPAAFIVPTGVTGGESAVATGMHRQRITESFAVLWIVSYAGSAAGGEAAAEIETVQDEIIRGLVGFVPVAGQGAISLSRSALTDADDGMFFFQTDFAFETNLRVFS